MKSSFKNLFGDDEDLKKETKVKVKWEPIKLHTEEQKPVVRKSGLKSLKESLGIEDKPKDTVIEVSVPVLDIPINLPILVETTKEKEEQVEELTEEVFVAPEPQLPKSVIAKAAEYIAKEARINESLYQNPNPPLADSNFDSVTKKLKQLETWVGRIASHGAGGGDANPHDMIEFLDRGIRFAPTPRMMYWNNTEDCVNITQADGSTLQVGLENYIRVFNNTANTFANGTFVEFTGVDSEGDAPTFRAYVNDANAQPLYSIGVLTTDVASNTHGRATVLGLVRDVDTTGNAVGEVWSDGDILWANPAYPGNYTKVKPTAPNVAIAVASVTNVSTTNGILLVRPAIFPRLFYGSFVSTTPQTAANTTSEFAITLDRTEFASGFVIENNSRIKALNSGLYNIQFSIQFSSTNASAKNIFIFPKKNGVNIQDSSTVFTITGNGTNLVPYLNYIVSLNANDYIEIFFGVSDTAAVIASPAVPAYSPNIPPVLLTVTEVAL